jgi:hypothetical protein
LAGAGGGAGSAVSTGCRGRWWCARRWTGSGGAGCAGAKSGAMTGATTGAKGVSPVFNRITRWPPLLARRGPGAISLRAIAVPAEAANRKLFCVAPPTTEFVALEVDDDAAETVCIPALERVILTGRQRL